MNDLYEMKESIDTMVQDFLKKNTQRVSAEKLGLDIRSGTVYVGDDFIATTVSSNRSLRYYGGFEYISSEDFTQYGDYVFYFAESDRVSEAIERFHTEAA